MVDSEQHRRCRACLPAGRLFDSPAVLLIAAALSLPVILAVLRPPAGDEELPPSSPVGSQESGKERRPAELLEAVLGTMIDGVVVVSPSLSLLYVNRAARRLLDLGERPVTGRLISELLRSAPLQELIELSLRTSEQRQAELQLTRQRLTIAVSAAPLDFQSQRGLLIVLHDVTDLRRLERMRREFVSNVSHELKTPLTSIQAYADTLLSGGLEDASHNVQFVERISEQAERLQTLIHDLLRLARIEADDVALELVALDIGQLVDECGDDRSGLAASKQIALTLNRPPQAVLARAEEESVRTILGNLIDNAINYTPNGGSVEVAWGERAGECWITVSDTGVGIPREHQNRIFERFYRVDRARSRAIGGTGLGLSIVKHLVQALNGRIELESEQGRGSKFTVWLPLSQENVSRNSLEKLPEP